MHPRHAVFRVISDNVQADRGSARVARDVQSLRDRPLDHISRHAAPGRLSVITRAFDDLLPPGKHPETFCCRTV